MWQMALWQPHAVTLLLLCRYPHALFFLELLQSEEFRTALASSQVKVGVAWPGAMRMCCDMHWQFVAMYVHVQLHTQQHLCSSRRTGADPYAAVLPLAALPCQPAQSSSGPAAGTGAAGHGTVTARAAEAVPQRVQQADSAGSQHAVPAWCGG